MLLNKEILLPNVKTLNRCLALAAFVSSAVYAEAQTIAIENVVVYTANEQADVLESATVVFGGGKIIAINPVDVKADIQVDGSGKILTPGFIASNTTLGLQEVSAVAASNDTKDAKAGLDFDPSLAFNPQSTVIPFSRQGGISHSLITATAKGPFMGLAFVANLSGELDSNVKPQQALVFQIGGKAKGSRASDLQLLKTKLKSNKEAIAEASKKKASDKKAKDKTKADKPESLLFKKLLAGELPLLAKVDRSADIAQLLVLKKAYGFDMVIYGGAGALVLADQLVAEKVSVIVDPMRNLPEGFDALPQTLANAAKLDAAGVNVILTETDTHSLQQLRFHAGNAVANGLPYQTAIAAISAKPAAMLGLDSGVIATGKSATLVLWSGDPLELSSSVDSMWINGKEVTLRARQDLLRDRYMSEAKMPRAYIQPAD